MIQVLAAADRLGQARERRHDGGVVERGLARVLEYAAAFHVERHLAGHHQQRRAVGLCGGDRGRHVAGTRAADPDRGAEAAARPRIADRPCRHAPPSCAATTGVSLSCRASAGMNGSTRPPGTMNRWPRPSSASAFEDVVGAECGFGCRREPGSVVGAIMCWWRPVVAIGCNRVESEPAGAGGSERTSPRCCRRFVRDHATKQMLRRNRVSPQSDCAQPAGARFHGLRARWPQGAGAAGQRPTGEAVAKAGTLWHRWPDVPAAAGLTGVRMRV